MRLRWGIWMTSLGDDMKPITLREREVQRLKATGELLVVREVKPQPGLNWSSPPAKVNDGWFNRFGCQRGDDSIRCPLGKPGDRLWVRETFGLFQGSTAFDVQYQADYEPSEYEESGVDRWRSPVTMPKSASRSTVETVAVECKRALGITWAELESAGRSGNIAEVEERWRNTGNNAANPWCWFALVKEIK